MAEAVMFDCDGVLVDSETLIAEILVGMANDLGGSLTPADGHRMFHGVQLDLCAERISAHLGRDLTSDIRSAYRRQSAEVFRSRLAPMNGVEELIRSLRVPICAVSNSSYEKTVFNLKVTGLLQYFSGHVYSAADLARWKPEPDVYLHAAKGLGLDPTRCVVIEDSAVGVRSAALAGMAVIGFGHPDLLSDGAWRTCETMSEIGDLVCSLTRRERMPVVPPFE